MSSQSITDKINEIFNTQILLKSLSAQTALSKTSWKSLISGYSSSTSGLDIASKMSAVVHHAVHSPSIYPSKETPFPNPLQAQQYMHNQQLTVTLFPTRPLGLQRDFCFMGLLTFNMENLVRGGGGGSGSVCWQLGWESEVPGSSPSVGKNMDLVSWHVTNAHMGPCNPSRHRCALSPWPIPRKSSQGDEKLENNKIWTRNPQPPISH